MRSDKTIPVNSNPPKKLLFIKTLHNKGRVNVQYPSEYDPSELLGWISTPRLAQFRGPAKPRHKSDRVVKHERSRTNKRLINHEKRPLPANTYTEPGQA